MERGARDGGAGETAAGKAPAPEVEVRRSRRRRRTVSAYRQDGRVIVLVPASLSAREVDRWVEEMVGRLDRADERRRPTEDALMARAARLSDRYLGGLAQPTSVRWVENQNSRWGSCTPADGTIRLSTRLRGMPAWVVDYVLVHELAHLLVPGHDADFWAWVAHYPQSERARGYLLGWSAASNVEPPEEPDDADDADDTDGPAATDVD